MDLLGSLLGKCCFLSFLFFLPLVNAFAQQSPGLSVHHRKVEEQEYSPSTSDNYLRVDKSENFLRNDSLCLNFSVLLKGSVVASDNALVLLPEYTQGTDVYEFPPIRINGKKRSSYYRRERALTNPSDFFKNTPYTTVISDKNLDKEIVYDYSLLLPSVKDSGHLVLKYFKEDCCNLLLEKTDSLSLERKADTRPNNSDVKLLVVGYPEYKKNVTYLKPEEEKEKIRSETIIIRINYPLNQWKVLPQFAGNELELSRIDNWFRRLYSDAYQIQSGSIVGYASPEATYAYNLKLSKRRAQGFYDYFLKRYGVSHNLPEFSVKGAGEDWVGLEKAVRETNMSYKNQVLQIIHNYDIFKGREKHLMDLRRGDPYRYMLQVLFPSLRRIELTLQYKVRSFNDKELTSVWKQRPQDLSQKELYTVAEQNQKPEALEIAATYFPEDVTANINASSVALIKGNLDKAYEFLKKVWDKPEAFNNIGVYYMLRKDYEEARAYFQKAIKIDPEKAEINLQLLNSLRK